MKNKPSSVPIFLQQCTILQFQVLYLQFYSKPFLKFVEVTFESFLLKLTKCCRERSFCMDKRDNIQVLDILDLHKMIGRSYA